MSISGVSSLDERVPGAGLLVVAVDAGAFSDGGRVEDVVEDGSCLVREVTGVFEGLPSEVPRPVREPCVPAAAVRSVLEDVVLSVGRPVVFPVDLPVVDSVGRPVVDSAVRPVVEPGEPFVLVDDAGGRVEDWNGFFEAGEVPSPAPVRLVSDVPGVRVPDVPWEFVLAVPRPFVPAVSFVFAVSRALVSGVPFFEEVDALALEVADPAREGRPSPPVFEGWAGPFPLVVAGVRDVVVVLGGGVGAPRSERLGCEDPVSRPPAPVEEVPLPRPPPEAGARTSRLPVDVAGVPSPRVPPGEPFEAGEVLDGVVVPSPDREAGGGVDEVVWSLPVSGSWTAWWSPNGSSTRDPVSEMDSVSEMTPMTPCRRTRRDRRRWPAGRRSRRCRCSPVRAGPSAGTSSR